MDSPKGPKQLIENKYAKELCENFIKDKADILERYYEKEDANAFWFSIDTLDQYLTYIKAEGKRLNVDVNGVRIYLGSYSENTQNEGLTTVFITPTKKQSVLQKKEESSGSGDDAGAESEDAMEIESLNYGGIGNPPKIIFDY